MTSNPRLKRDIISPVKKDQDDLDEYLAFRWTFEPLGPDVWQTLHRCFLLQFALANPKCFPGDARAIMVYLGHKKRYEALCFTGIQTIDYLYYAEECHVDKKIPEIVRQVTANQMPILDNLAVELPGFEKVVWTPERRAYFSGLIRPQPAVA